MKRAVVRSHAQSNRELVESFVRYMQARNWSPSTVLSYRHAVERFIELLGANTVVGASRTDVHNYLITLFRREMSASSISTRTSGLRAFFKFLRVAGLIQFDPMNLIPQRKLPKRLPRVLTVKEVEAVINAANDPAERAIAETMYATGVRLSEVVNIRLENVDFLEHVILIEHGKGDKDRQVLFGQRAALAIRDYLEWRPSKCGYLFEVPPGNGRRIGDREELFVRGDHWLARFRMKGDSTHVICVGKVADLPTKEAAKAAFEKIVAKIPGGKIRTVTGLPAVWPSERPQHQYTDRAIRLMLSRMAARAKVKGVHPHGFRRAFACHMLANGAGIREIQELMGHQLVTTTQIYTTLTNEKLREIHSKFHPHAKGQNGKKD